MSERDRRIETWFGDIPEAIANGADHYYDKCAILAQYIGKGSKVRKHNTGSLYKYLEQKLREQGITIMSTRDMCKCILSDAFYAKLWNGMDSSIIRHVDFLAEYFDIPMITRDGKQRKYASVVFDIEQAIEKLD